MAIRLAGKLPDGDRNGVQMLGAELIARPQHGHLVLALVDTATLTTNVDTGAVTATLRVQRVEAVLRGDHRDAWRLMERAYLQRTRDDQLPLDFDYDLERLIAGDTARHEPDRP